MDQKYSTVLYKNQSKLEMIVPLEKKELFSRALEAISVSDGIDFSPQLSLKRLASSEVRFKSRKFLGTFLFSSKINTTYPRVHPSISSLALRPKLGLWWSNHVLDPILQVLTRLTKQHKTQ